MAARVQHMVTAISVLQHFHATMELEDKIILVNTFRMCD